ncbi:MAG TPA: LysR substrate-binding domain-containing protein [Planctomycetota bacterium]|nr:LysR substrate-binding domain-containing protein [Planctomycetota bacterium]
MRYAHEVSRSLPSTGALQAFESAAWHGSFTTAAKELHLTQSAVSRQIQGLEQHLGVDLFVRERQRIRLSAAGEHYLAHVRSAFDRLEAAALELRTLRRGGGVLQLAILPTYGTKWLIPRFPSFAELHPEIQVHFTTRLQVFDFATEDLDAAIHYGEAHWPGAVLDALMDEEVYVVCSAAYRKKHRLESPADLRRATLLQMSPRPNSFEDWLRAKGETGVDGRKGPRFEHHAMALQAAIAGLGVAVLPAFVVDDELAAGRVVEAFPDTRVRTGKGYWLVYPERRRDLPALRAFRDWLLEQHGRPSPSASAPG